MHFPSALKERLIDLASSRVCPSLPAPHEIHRLEAKVVQINSISCIVYSNTKRFQDNELSLHDFRDMPDLSIRSEPARSTTTSFPFRTIGGLIPLDVWELLLLFMLETTESLTDLLTCTCAISDCTFNATKTF